MSRSNECFQHWLDAWKAGDSQGRDRLLEWANHRLKALAHRIVRPNDRVRRFVDSDDVLQEALINMIRRFDRPPETIDVFFARSGELIRRALIDFARKYYGPRGDGERMVSNVSPRSGSREGFRLPDPNLSPCSQTLEDESYQALAVALESLPPADRDLVDLRYIHGMSQAETARLLGITDRTVRTRWARIRCQLNESLGSTEIEE